MEGISLGIDIGGTNTAFGIVNGEGTVLYENSVPTAEFSNPEELIRCIYADLNSKNYTKDLLGIGVGAPNGNHFTGNIEFAPNLPWQGVIEISKLFSTIFDRKTILTNDANAAAVGEMLFGAAKKMKNFVTITLGTGLGSGIVVNKKIVYGHNGFAGEYGHIRVIPNGRPCACGRLGCLETYASATGVVRSIQLLESNNKATSPLLTLTKPTSKDVNNWANQGDPFAKEILDYTAKILGEALADFMCFSNPEAYILFGGYAHAGQPLADKVKFYMEQAALNIYKNSAQVLISELQDRNAAILGTAAIVFSDDIDDLTYDY